MSERKREVWELEAGSSLTLPPPTFDREMQAIANIEFLLGQFSGGTRKRILEFVTMRLAGLVEDRVNQKE
jgi:hypothetical protein